MYKVIRKLGFLHLVRRRKDLVVLNADEGDFYLPRETESANGGEIYE